MQQYLLFFVVAVCIFSTIACLHHDELSEEQDENLLCVLVEVYENGNRYLTTIPRGALKGMDVGKCHLDRKKVIEFLRITPIENIPLTPENIEYVQRMVSFVRGTLLVAVCSWIAKILYDFYKRVF